MRVHDDGAANRAASELGARAFTRGLDIFFAQGRWAPETAAGRRLLAHELAHTVQQRGGALPIIQADFESDFAGKQEVAVEGTPVQPPGTVRVKTYAAEGGKDVYAPFGIYSPGEIPEKYQDRIMESSQAFKFRAPDLPPGQAADLEVQRKANAGELTVRDMKAYSGGLSKGTAVRLMMVRVGGDYRFVGLDISTLTASGAVVKGFVESEPATGGVGRALFADRVVRALSSGATGMDLTVYTTQRTESFHAQIFATVGRQGVPKEDDHYTLNTRELIRIALSWSGSLTAQQRLELVTLASRDTPPTPAEAQAALSRVTEGEKPVPPGQLAPETLENMRQFGKKVSGSVKKAVELKEYAELSDPATAKRVIEANGGYATVGGRMYRLQQEGANIRVGEMNPLAIRQAIHVGEAEAPAPAPAARSRNVFDPPPMPAATAPEGGVPQVKEGDVIVVPYQTFIEARDAKTGEVFFGLFEGARWYRLETIKGEAMAFDPLTGEQLVKVKTPGGPSFYARPYDPEPYAPGQAGGGSRLAKGAVGVGGAIQVINELLGPIGAALKAQEAWIARGRAEISFFAALGAEPLTGIWDRQGERPAAPGQKPDTAVFTHWYFPYVVDINADGLRANLPKRVASYQELQNLLSIGKAVGTLKGGEGKFSVVVNRWDRGKEKTYDITEAVTQTMTQAVQGTEERLKGELAAMPASDRAGKIFRLNAGASLYRSEQGQQIIMNSAEHLGANAWVRELSRRSSNIVQYIWTGYRGTRVLVAPVNAAAHNAAAFAQYRIYRPIDDVWKEVKDAGRTVSPASLPSFTDDVLNSFSAGPGKGAVTDFGFTTYTRDPSNPGQYTLGTGELKSFWVNGEDLIPVDDKDVDAFVKK